MFNTVDVYFEDDDETETYKIVTTVRGNSLKNLISKESPLGAAIFGHKVGDRCEVKVNDDYSYFVKIMKIENTVDDGSDDCVNFNLDLIFAFYRDFKRFNMFMINVRNGEIYMIKLKTFGSFTVGNGLTSVQEGAWRSEKLESCL